MTDKAKPVFDKRIFWDVVFENIDYDAKANFVIERVFERGDVQDIRNCRRYYGDEKVAEALTKAKYLSLSTIHLACAVLNNNLTDYRCFIESQSNPTHWIY
jgi:nicotinamide mononucleotide adenylyltransferase